MGYQSHPSPRLFGEAFESKHGKLYECDPDPCSSCTHFADGYSSIGCAPWTQRSNDPTDDRAGRWVGTNKTECGIHALYAKTAAAPTEEVNA